MQNGKRGRTGNGPKRKLDEEEEDEPNIFDPKPIDERATKSGKAAKLGKETGSVMVPSSKKQKLDSSITASKSSTVPITASSKPSKPSNGKVAPPSKLQKSKLPQFIEEEEMDDEDEQASQSDAGSDDNMEEVDGVVIESFDDWAAQDISGGGEGQDEEWEDDDSEMDEAGNEVGDGEDDDEEMDFDRDGGHGSSGSDDENDDDEDDDDEGGEVAGSDDELTGAAPEEDITLNLIEGDVDDEDARNKVPSDYNVVKEQVQEVVRVLSDFKNLGKGVPRATYMTTLTHLLASYFSYTPYLVSILVPLFPISEVLPFFEANETPRPVTVRSNTLKATRRELVEKLEGRGVRVGPVGSWEKAGLVVFESKVPIGATPEYLAGQYMLQSPSSFLPVLALAPKEKERVLDMCAAPGGKTTHMAALMRNTGVIVANDANRSRCKGLVGNIQRLGVRNAIVSNYDAREYPKVMGGFDRVLLDAPCSGTGVISKDPSVKVNKTEKDFQKLSGLQKELLLHAIDSVDAHSSTGGFIVYSTCSVTVHENEEVVNYALKKRDVKLVDTGLEFGKEGFVNFCGKSFHSSLKLTRRYYPHTNNMDGFFVAKLQKLSNKIPKVKNGDGDPVEEPKAVEEEWEANSTKKSSGKTKKQVEKDGEPKFDDEGDADIIRAARLKSLKKKGIRVGSAKSETGKSAA
ncbi:rRNA (cytosine-C5-)-methyltransferase nop2 [Gonapodya sp. JEL0774]|nr:rRNA (cytosine-C5-)-methyltransferase nop2 [Gonapodya sp. JEL0774]